MIALVVTMTVAEANRPAFEQVMTGLVESVNRLEPGVLTYTLCRDPADAGSYRMLEVYADAEARALHGQSDHFKAALQAFSPLLDGRPTVEVLDVVA